MFVETVTMTMFFPVQGHLTRRSPPKHLPPVTRLSLHVLGVNALKVGGLMLSCPVIWLKISSQREEEGIIEGFL